MRLPAPFFLVRQDLYPGEWAERILVQVVPALAVDILPEQELPTRKRSFLIHHEPMMAGKRNGEIAGTAKEEYLIFRGINEILELHGYFLTGAALVSSSPAAGVTKVKVFTTEVKAASAVALM